MNGTRIGKILTASALALALTLTASAEVIQSVHSETRFIADDVQFMTKEGTAQGERPQQVCVITADPDKSELVIGGPVLNKSLVHEMKPTTRDSAEVIAAVNGDHFSFQTGIPMGMSISDGEIVTSPVPAYNADDYYFHALGITADGKVLTGENPTLYMQYTVGDHTGTIDRINRTRENWEGGQICLFTPRYGDSTDTNPVGAEFIIRVDEGAVNVGSSMKGTIVAVDEDGDAPIEDGHVVLSINLLRYEEVEKLQVGDEIEFLFSFEQEEWNDVTFAVGGNLTAVANGEVQEFNYTVGAFTGAAPRTALGVREDGTIVLATVDGRSDEAAGLTANEMATYLADDLDCEHAILLDGGGSTAMAVADAGGVLQTVNVPSEERPVGNGVLLVKRESTSNGIDHNTLIVCVAAVVVVLAGIVVVKMVKTTKSKASKGTDNENIFS